MSPKSFTRMLALALFATGCGAGSSAETVRIRTEVHIVRGDARERLDVSPAEARMIAAAKSIEQSLGHPLPVDVDAALTPLTGGEVVRQAAASLEALARYFGSYTGKDPPLQAFLRDKLARVRARYDASHETMAASFEDATGTLVFTMREPGQQGWVPGRFEIDTALDDGLARFLALRFERKTPALVDPSDHVAYFRYLSMPRSRPNSESPEARAQRLLAILQLEARIRAESLHTEVEKYLVDAIVWSSNARTEAPIGRQLSAAYVAWIDQRFFEMPSHPRSALFDRLFKRQDRTEPILPELDRERLALLFFQRSVPPDEENFGAFDQSRCLFQESDKAIHRTRSCASVYPFLTENEERCRRFAAMLVKTQRRDYLVAALANGHVRVLLGVLETHGGALYADALRILVDVDHYTFREMTGVLRDEVTRLWPKREELRPLLFRLIVEDYVRVGYRDDKFAGMRADYH